MSAIFARWTLVALALAGSGGASAADPPLATRKDKVSYAMAVAMARSIQRQGVDVDVNMFALGLSDGLAGGKLLMTRAEMHQALNGVLVDLQKKRKRAEAANAVNGSAPR